MNLFAESLVCVEAKTGRRVWHFQTVHHGLWDYDLPAPPVLGDITVGRRSYRNTFALLRDVSNRMDFELIPLIVTDGFDFYQKVVRRIFAPACL